MKTKSVRAIIMTTNSVRAKANLSVSCGLRKLDLSKDKRLKMNLTVKQQCGKQRGTISSGDQMSSEDKRNVKKDLMGILNRTMTEKLQSRLRKSGIQCFGKERINLDVDALDDDALRKMKNVLNGSLGACSAIDHEDRILSTTAKKLDIHTRLPVLHEENTCPRTGTPVTKTTSGTSLMVDDQCVKRALQLARSTNRYSEIMSKSMSDKTDPRQLQQETERWVQLNKKDALERNHQREREAFRTALEKVERTVEFQDNLLILEELETLSQCSLSDNLYGSGSWMALRDLRTGKVLYPLEQLGLRIKKEFTADGDDDDTFLCAEAEEGEILE